jgi:hypothetical protein
MNGSSVISLRERKYIKMYQEFYSNGNLNLALDSKQFNSRQERRFTGSDGHYHVIRLVN